MNTKSRLAEELKDKAYRDAFVASQIRIGLPMQCRALRESRSLTQPQLAEVAGMSQPRISEIERPGERKLNVETLLRLASAFDVALQVRFSSFSKLVDDDDSIALDTLDVPSFDEDMARLRRIEERTTSGKTSLEQSSISKFQSPIYRELVNSTQPSNLLAFKGAGESSTQVDTQNSSSQTERKHSAHFGSIAS